MGRDKRNEKRPERWTKLTLPMMQEPAWRALSSNAQALYPWLRLEWRGPANNNNGKISLSVRQAADSMGLSLNTVVKAFHELQAKGFIVVTKVASLGIGGSARCTTYELTEIGLPPGVRPKVKIPEGRKLYKEWRKGHDFPIHKARANNPKGLRGNLESHLKNEDEAVLDFETYQKEASQK